jgi:hypothetical protein
LNPADRLDDDGAHSRHTPEKVPIKVLSATQVNEPGSVGFLIDLRLRIPLEARMEKGEVR